MNLLKYVFTVGILLLLFGSLPAQNLTCDSLLKRAEELGRQQDLMQMAGLVEKIEAVCKAQYTENSKQYADALAMHGVVYEGFGRIEDALALFLQERDLHNLLQLPYDDEDYGNNQSNLGQCYLVLGDMESAKVHNDSAIAIAIKVHGKKHSLYGHRLVNQGIIFFKQPNPNLDSAEICFRTGLRVLRNTNDTYYVIQGLNAFGLLLKTRGKHKEAIEKFKEAYQIARAKFGESNLLTALSLTNEAVVRTENGEYYEGDKLLDRTIRVIEKSGFTANPLYRAMLTNQAVANVKLGKYDEAIRLLTKASLYNLVPNPVDSAEYYSSLALVHQARGDVLEAMKGFRIAKAMFEKANQTLDEHYFVVLSNLGSLYSEIGNYDEATRLTDEAINISKRIWKTPSQLSVALLDNAANNYYDHGEYEKADSLLSEALSIAQQTSKANQNLAAVYQTYGLFKYNTNDLQQSKAYISESRRLYSKTARPESIDYCMTMVSAAVLENLTGSPKKAEKWSKTTLRRLRNGGNERTLAYVRALSEYGKILAARHDSVGAITQFRVAQARLMECLNAGFTFLSENGKERFLQQYEDDLHNPQLFTYRSWREIPEAAELVYDNELDTKGLLLYSVQSVGAAIKASGDTALIHLFDDWKNIKQLLARQFSQPSQDRLVRQNILDSLAHIADSAEATLSLRSIDFYAARTPVHWQRVRDSLHAGEAAIEFTRFRFHDNRLKVDSAYYAAVVVRPGDRYPHFVPLFNEQQLLDHLGTVEDLKNLQERIGVIYLGNGETPLYQLIWRPLDSLLAGVKTIYFAPAGLLHRLSFSLISAGQPLLPRYDLRLVGSTREVALGRKPVTADSIPSALLCGGIQYNADSLCLVQNKPKHRSDPFDLPGDDHASLALRGGCLAGAIPFLPGTLVETDRLYVRLNARFPTRLFQGCVATEAEIKALGKNAPAPGILHIATHGFFCDIPQVKAAADQLPLFRTGLLLAGAERVSMGGQPFTGMDDGILYAYEIADLNLTGTKLVVLSACETALGEIRGGEGVYGLARAFRLAGAEHVLMSLWQINDAQTVRFMETFYDKWLGGQDIHDAFRDTQRELRQAGVGEDVWGAFVLL